MKTIEMTVYQFDELDDAAKQRARDWYIQGMEYPWFNESLDSIRAFCAEFGIELKDWSIGDSRGCYLKTNAENHHFRGFGLKNAELLKNKELTGYCLDCDIANEFYTVFKNSGDAKYAFEQALEEALLQIRKDVEYHYSNESVDENILINEYEFDESGRRI